MSTQERKIETRTVYVKLSPSEQRERAMQATELVRRHDEADAHLKLQTKLLKQEVEKHAAKLRELALAAREGTELQEVTCTWVPDYASGIARLLRDDTNAVVETRSLTSEERQTQMFLS
ncbi:MAG: hypothetical protein Q8S73_43065 [Deltaproteobacteria bacterium]|nr:hypothetical protein [Myxococcales bacterium]MDP3220944.1 hypothetical protein [Deltaproteobacteria bacterium]